MKKLVSIILILALATAFLPSAGVYAEHNFSVAVKVEPTCEAEGSIEYVCNGCKTLEQPVKIMGDSYLTVDELLAYSESKIPNMRLTCTPKELIEYYISIGEKYGIRGDIAYMQAIKETGWFKFNRPNSYLAYVDGQWVRIYEPRPEGLYVTPQDNNFCGLGVTGKLGDEKSLCRFETAELGVTAHIQHLYAYATTAELPEGEVIVDPRFRFATRGCAETWVALGDNNWTSSATYGEEIVNAYIAVLENYSHSAGNSCGEKKLEIIPAKGHSWSDWFVTVAADRDTSGEEFRVCTECMKRETRSVDRIDTAWGDLDYDGELTVSDALIALRGAAGLKKTEGAMFIIADVDRDEEITVNDSLVILRSFVFGMPVEEKSYKTGKAVNLLNTRNETFVPVPDNSDTSLPQYFWLPQGTVDYIVSESAYSADPTLKYFTLRSGLRVYQHDAKVDESATILKTKLVAAKAESIGKYTYFTVAASQKTPYRVRMNGLFDGDETDKTANCSNFTSIDFIFTDAQGAPEVLFGDNPLFSAASVTANAEDNTVTYSFTLKRRGIFCGYNSYFDESGNLVIRMHNPPDVSNGRLDGTVVCIDVGHGGYDTGASGYLIETDENLKVALSLRERLTALGASVYMTRDNHETYTDGTRITSATYSAHRIQLISSFDPDILISVHHNSYTDPSAHGTEALYFYGFNQALAQKVSDNMASVSGMRNRGGKYQNVFVYRNHDFMSILLECGFVSNKEDSEWLAGEGNTDKLTGAVADALISYFS